jgi:hypothetical protein
MGFDLTPRKSRAALASHKANYQHWNMAKKSQVQPYC